MGNVHAGGGGGAISPRTFEPITPDLQENTRDITSSIRCHVSYQSSSSLQGGGGGGGPYKAVSRTCMNIHVRDIKITTYTVRNTLREIELQNDYCNGCGLTDHGCGMTLLSNELQIRTIGSIPGITEHNWLYHVWHHHNNLHGLSVINYLSHIVIYSLQNLLFGFRCHAVIIRNIYCLWRWKYISISLICNYKWIIMLNQCYFCL